MVKNIKNNNNNKETKSSSDKIVTKTLAKNRKAYFNYEILNKYEAGIVLQGTEVKSIKQGKVSIKECYGKFINRELYLIGMHIAEFSNAGIFNHETMRKRKLLLHKKELKKLEDELDRNNSYTIVPLAVFQRKHLIKVQFGLVKGKREYEKRDTIKAREESKNIDRAVKNFNKY